MREMKKIIDERRFKKDIRKIRKQFLFFGYNTSHMTDEEFIKHVGEVGKVFAKLGVAAKDAAKSLTEVMTKVTNV